MTLLGEAISNAILESLQGLLHRVGFQNSEGGEFRKKLAISEAATAIYLGIGSIRDIPDIQIGCVEVSHFLQNHRVFLLNFGKELREETAELILRGGLAKHEPGEFTGEFLLVAAENLEEELLHIVIGLHAEDIELVQDNGIQDLVITGLGTIVKTADIPCRGAGRRLRCRAHWKPRCM